jgi:hypothetical protein
MTLGSPTLDPQAGNATKMINIFSHHDQVVLQSRGRNENVRVANQLTFLVEQRI